MKLRAGRKFPVNSLLFLVFRPEFAYFGQNCAISISNQANSLLIPLLSVYIREFASKAARAANAGISCPSTDVFQLCLALFPVGL